MHPGLSTEGSHGEGVAECRAEIGHTGPFGLVEHAVLRRRRLDRGHQPVGGLWRHVSIATDLRTRGVVRPAAVPTLRLPALPFAGGGLRELLWAIVLGLGGAGVMRVSLLVAAVTFCTILHHVFATGTQTTH